jgi:NDP-sugar pyrophosphorylase family protein
VACGDNVFTSTLNGLVQAHDAKGAPVIAVRRLGLSKTNEPKSAVVLDRNGRVVEYVEKSITTSETITGTCLYIFPERTVPRIWEYEKVTGKHDQPGELISWLCKRDLVYGYQLKGMWWDIGTPTGYSEAQSWFDTHPAASIQLRKFTSKKEP